MPKDTNKRLVVLLIIFSVLAIGLGYFQIKGAIYAPFGRISQKEVSQQTEQEISILVEQDTDKDGLTDFDERFVYFTSAYLADSDSDGFSDKQEIDAESNPLNPEVTPYNIGEEALGSGLQGETQDFLEKTFSAPESEQSQGSPIETISDQLFETEVSVQEIRDLLVNSAGLNKDIVDKLDDNTLIKLYNETKQETGIDLTQLTAPDEVTRQFSDLLEINQLRQLLIEQGVDSEMLDQVDDETLRSMFLQSLLQTK